MANRRTRVQFDDPAMRLAALIEESRWQWNSRLTLYFTGDAVRISPGGRDAQDGNVAGWEPRNFSIAVEYPFAPSLPSCVDMLRDLSQGLCPVIYDEVRWEADPRIPEQAGPSLLDDWKLGAVLDRSAA
jgi:hypothetical protein